MVFRRVVAAATLASVAQHVQSVPLRIAPGQAMLLQVGSGQDGFKVLPIAARSADTVVAPSGKRVVVTVTTERSMTAPFRHMLQRLLPAAIGHRLGAPVRNEVSVPINAAGQQGKSVVEITVTHRNTFLQVLSLFVFALSLALFAAVWCGCAFRCGPAPDGEVEFELRFGNQLEGDAAQFVHASDDEDDEGVVVVGALPLGQHAQEKSLATKVIVA